MARVRPALVRSMISDLSNSEMAANRVESNRPVLLEVSHNGSPTKQL
jgi:hypothetical protein